MAKQPFTPEGFQEKQAELYALPNDQLLTHANEIRDNLKGWVIDNFLLSADQQAYLDTIHEDWMNLAACQLRIAIKDRLPIYLEPIVVVDGASKLAGSHYDMESTSQDGVFKARGELRFYFRYT